ncbi:hypothetical protein BS50DRAFT_574887 [Corynespora cassiicola Philippines]|uniref:Peroxin 11C n=1 Tax=Corynespora cassiicola Philippines TaxID=1448308 RepID=A0A2T2NMH9_CORCC|nr:hypothetical protein BS50DRAFT_574887 [Corynespora cassiicola Philippines]
MASTTMQQLDHPPPINPTAAATEADISPPPPPPSQPPAAKPRFARLKRLATAADTSLLRLNALLSTPSGTDTLLCTLSYTLELLTALLSRLLARRLHTLALSLATKTVPLGASTSNSTAADTLLSPTPISDLPLLLGSSTQSLAKLVEGMKALAALVGDFRVFVRLWGLVGVYVWLRGTLLAPEAPAASPTSCTPAQRRRDRKMKLVRAMTYVQIGAGVAFQVLENGAYLSSKGVLTGRGWAGEAGKEREGKWWVWSSQFWAVHVFLEVLRVGVLAWGRDSKPGKGGEKEKESEKVGEKALDARLGDGEKEDKLQELERQKEDWLWWRDLVSNVAYAPLTLHWSTEQGFLSDVTVGVLGTVAGGVLLVDAWRGTK